MIKEKSSYGHGSSYSTNSDTVIKDDFFWRFTDMAKCSQKTQNEPIEKLNLDFIKIFNRVLNDNQILQILKSDFIMDITKIDSIKQDKYERFKNIPSYKININNNEKILQFPELDELNIYKMKYLKYKQKYLQLKLNK